MDVACIPFSRLSWGNDLARDYAVAPDKVLPLFAHDYRDPQALKPLLDAQAAVPRAPLREILVAYNREVGGSVEGAGRLDDAFCVISGQQVGLLYGPAYTTYKLFTVVDAARVLEAELGVPVVPVFWVESEDHDWDEVNRFFWRERRYRLEDPVAPGTPISRIEVDPAPFLAELKEALPEGDAWGLVEPERNVARWHVRNLARLVPEAVYVEPRLLREPLRGFAARIADEPELVDASLRVDTGYDRPLAPPEGAYLFDNEGIRTRVARGTGVPERWSSDVASRVLVQNMAFRPLMAVCGPSEIAYWSQLKGAHEALGVPLPAVLPRDGATLVEAGIASDAAKLGLDLEEVVRGQASPPARGQEDPVATRLRRLAREAGQLVAALDAGSLDLPPNAQRPFRRTVERLHGDLDKLAHRIDDARAEMEGAGKRRYEKVLRELRPRDGLQERTHSLFPYLLRHGPGLAARLRETFDPFEIGHYLVRL